MAYEILETCMLVPGFSKSECASWVQAWGSIAAIVAAILVAWWQRRSEHRAAGHRARARAEIAGTSVLLQMNPLKGAVSAVLVVLAAVGKGPVFPEALYSVLDRQVFPTEDELIAIADFHPGCARLLVRARNLSRQGVATLKLLESPQGPGYVDVEAAKYLTELFTLVAGQLAEAHGTLEAFVPME